MVWAKCEAVSHDAKLSANHETVSSAIYAAGVGKNEVVSRRRETSVGKWCDMCRQKPLARTVSGECVTHVSVGMM